MKKLLTVLCTLGGGVLVGDAGRLSAPAPLLLERHEAVC